MRRAAEVGLSDDRITIVYKLAQRDKKPCFEWKDMREFLKRNDAIEPERLEGLSITLVFSQKMLDLIPPQFIESIKITDWRVSINDAGYVNITNKHACCDFKLMDRMFGHIFNAAICSFYNGDNKDPLNPLKSVVSYATEIGLIPNALDRHVAFSNKVKACAKVTGFKSEAVHSTIVHEKTKVKSEVVRMYKMSLFYDFLFVTAEYEKNRMGFRTSDKDINKAIRDFIESIFYNI